MTYIDRSTEILTKFLLGSRVEVPKSVTKQLADGLFSSVAMFCCATVNSIVVALLALSRQPSALFIVWLGLECVTGIIRFSILIYGKKCIRQGVPAPHVWAAVMGCVWAATLGFGACISLLSGDWVLTTVVFFSTGGMICGICLRNFGTPRLAAIMAILVLVPCALVSLFSSENIIAIIIVQVPVYLVTIIAASFGLNELFISRVKALADLESSEKFNRAILTSSPDRFLVLDEGYRVIFINHVEGRISNDQTMIGKNWVSLLSPSDRAAGMEILQGAAKGVAGETFRFYDEHSDSEKWFHILATRISADTSRILIVARDITLQKNSEEQALWMARHDALTALPNRTVLQELLDSVLERPAKNSALLLLDIDNFKVVNDIFGHDAGDALLKFFADRLVAATKGHGTVTRMGGDEFAIILSSASELDAQAVAERVYTELQTAFLYKGRRLECNVSIGTSIIPCNGKNRAEILKAADVALYVAKSDGRGKMRIYHPDMMKEFQSQQAMLSTARAALQNGTIVPFYQPKVAMKNRQIVGFEALLRIVNKAGDVHGPAAINAAFNDPLLAPLISDSIVDGVLKDIQTWRSAGLEFGHVAINISAADFRMRNFAEMLAGKLAMANIPAQCLQVEVTETVFLGAGASYIADTLQHLKNLGVKIALDDFGTGFASLSHLVDYSVDALKIDQSFINGIGKDAKADAITSAVVKLGLSLGLEVVAEGIEYPEQESCLLKLGCNTGQGFIYSPAVPASKIPQLLSEKAGRLVDNGMSFH